MVFHQAKKYCKECEDFICNKCAKKHDASHTLLKIEEITENVSSKINLYLEVSKGKFPNDENSNDTTDKIEYDENIQQNSIEKIDELINKLICIKKKMLKFFELRKELIKKHNSEEHNIVYEDAYTTEDLYRSENRWIECFENLPNPFIDCIGTKKSVDKNTVFLTNSVCSRNGLFLR